jgi:autotransporter translocation and assembly factor TamB
MVAQARLTQIASRSIQTALSDALNLPVSLQDLTLQWFPSAVILHQVRISSPDADPSPLVTVNSVEVRFSLLSLLADHIIIHRIAVDSPTLELNPVRLEHVIRSATPRGGATPILIREITVHDGTIRYADPGRQVRAEIDQLRGTADFGLLIKRAAITLSNGRAYLERGDWRQVFSSISGRVNWRPGQLALHRVIVNGPDSRFSLDGTARLNAAPVLQLDVAASLPLGQLTPWLPPDHRWEGALNLEAKISGPWTPGPDPWRSAAALSLSGHTDIDHLTIDAEPFGTATALWQWRQGRVTVSRVTGALLSGTVDGHATVSFPPLHPAIDATVDFSKLQAGPPLRRFVTDLAELPDGQVSGHLAVRGDGWTFSHLSGEGHVTIVASASSRPAQAPSDTPSPLRGALRRIAHLTADAQWHADQFTFHRLELVSRQENQLSVQGTLTIRGPMALSGSWQFADLSEISDWAATSGLADQAEWTGTTAGNVTATGTWDQPRLAGSLTVRELGHFDDSIDEGRTDFTYDAGTLTWKDGHLRQGSGSADFSGAITFPPTPPRAVPPRGRATAPARLHASIAVANGELGRILRFFDVTIPIDGRAGGTLTLAGSSDAFHLHGPVYVTDGRLYGQPISHGDATMDLTQDGITLTRLVLAEGKGTLHGSGRIGFDGTFQSTLNVEQLTLESLHWLHTTAPLVSGVLSGQLSGSGSWQQPRVDCQMALSALAVGNSSLGRGSATARLTGTQLVMTAELDNPRLSAEGTVQLRDTVPATMRWHVTTFPIVLLLRPFIPAWPEQISLTASGEGELSGHFVGPSNLNGRLSFPTLSAQVVDYSLVNDGPVEFEINNGRIDVRRARLTGTGTSLAAEGSLTLFARYDLFIHGEADLAILRLFFPSVTYGKGKGYLALQISDRWHDPKMAGGISLQDGLVRLEAIDQPFTISYADLVFDGQQLVLDELRGGIGKGNIQASGRITLHGLRPADYRVLVEVNDASITPIEGLSGVVDGSLWLQGELAGGQSDEGGRHLLKGDLHLVRATYSKRIDLKTLLSTQPGFSSVTLSLPSFLNSMALQVHVWGHQAIWIRNNIATIPLDIDLEARGTVERPIIVGRIFTTGGTFTFQHTPFQVTQGSIDFLDPKQTRAVIDLKASTRIREYEIDLALSGRADRLDLEMSSDPVLSQSDILSVMTVGRTSEEVSTAGAGSVATSEAASLLVNELLEEPVQQIGIDYFQIDSAINRSGQVVGPQLTVGKSLLDRHLLLLYSRPMDPTTPQSYRLEYDFNRHMSLVGEGDDSGSVGGDIKFRFDFR